MTRSMSPGGYSLAWRSPVVVALASMVALSCGSSGGDRSADAGPATVLGQGRRIREISNPAAPTKVASNSIVQVSGAAVTFIDNYDETNDGRGRGTIYIQDLDSTSIPEKDRAYSGISLFSPAFVPSDLKPSPGDVLDFSGQYQENGNIGAAVFGPGQLLVQLARPVGVFRFEAKPLEPTVVKLEDLGSYATGKQWVGMLITIKDVEMLGDPFTSTAGRVTNVISGVPDDRNAGVITNELMALPPGSIDRGKKYKQITGICTFFFNLHLAPRFPSDFVAN